MVKKNSKNCRIELDVDPVLSQEVMKVQKQLTPKCIDVRYIEYTAVKNPLLDKVKFKIDMLSTFLNYWRRESKPVLEGRKYFVEFSIGSSLLDLEFIDNFDYVVELLQTVLLEEESISKYSFKISYQFINCKWKEEDFKYQTGINLDNHFIENAY